MSERDENGTEGGPFAELLARLAQESEGDGPPVRSELAERVESLVGALLDAVNADWPTAEELRRLPAADFAKLARQLSLVIDRLATLRVELLGGRHQL